MHQHRLSKISKAKSNHYLYFAQIIYALTLFVKANSKFKIHISLSSGKCGLQAPNAKGCLANTDCDDNMGCYIDGSGWGVCKQSKYCHIIIYLPAFLYCLLTAYVLPSFLPPLLCFLPSLLCFLPCLLLSFFPSRLHYILPVCPLSFILSFLPTCLPTCCLPAYIWISFIFPVPVECGPTDTCGAGRCCQYPKPGQKAVCQDVTQNTGEIDTYVDTRNTDTSDF